MYPRIRAGNLDLMRVFGRDRLIGSDDHRGPRLAGNPRLVVFESVVATTARRRQQETYVSAWDFSKALQDDKSRKDCKDPANPTRRCSQ